MDPIAEVLELLKKVERKFEELRQLVNGVLAKVPDALSWVVDKFMDAWNRMLTKLGEFWDWFTDKLSFAGDPFLLSNTADRWRNDVAGPADQLVRAVDDANLTADDRWEGFGAEEYRQRAPQQREAMTSVSTDYAGVFAAALSGLQIGIIVFWATIAAAIIALIAGIASASVATGTIIGLPAVPVLVTLAITAALVSIGAGYLTLQGNANNAVTTLASAASGVKKWPEFAQ